MKTYNFNGKEVKMYDSIDELPIANFQKYNKYILIDSGLGSDIESVDTHIVNLAKLIKTDMKKAQQELQNLRQTMHLIVSGLSPRYLAFASLIYSINGKKVTDLSDSNLKNIIDDLREVKHSFILDLLYKFKKKVNFELNTYFPSYFESAKENKVYENIKHKTFLILEEIVYEKDNVKQIFETDEQMFNFYTPKSFNGNASVEIMYDKQYESSCLLINKELNTDSKSMTTFQFYNALDIIKKNAENKMKAHKRLKQH